jgi:hypothetical protein
MNALGIVPEEQNVAISNADKEGTLYKKGPNSSTGWNKRYFRLQDRILYYYKSEKVRLPARSSSSSSLSRLFRPLNPSVCFAAVVLQSSCLCGGLR